MYNLYIILAVIIITSIKTAVKYEATVYTYFNTICIMNKQQNKSEVESAVQATLQLIIGN